jgi:metallo-beta-lactamase family protein
MARTRRSLSAWHGGVAEENKMAATLKFLGASGSVTGARFLVQAAGRRILVDCGLCQERELASRNWDPFPVAPDELAAVVLTHGHLDHCGYLPRLVKQGYRGPVWCTSATAEIAAIVMADTARLQEEDAEKKRQRHQREKRVGPYPEIPLYTDADAQQAVLLLQSVPYRTPVSVADGVSILFRDAGHILGSSIVEMSIADGREGIRLAFSGDLGRRNTPILKDPEQAGRSDYVVIESTYGDRAHHTTEDIEERLAAVINRTCPRGGSVIIPSFAVERTQDLLYRMSGLLRAGRIPRVPLFLDSPMAARVTDVFRRHPEMFDVETQERLRRGEHPCDFPGMRVCRTAEESQTACRARGAVVIAGSGMCTGGRIKHHLVSHIGRPESTVLFVGFQAHGTLGRRILDGEREVRILGADYTVRASVERLNGLSGHAGQDELLAWLRGAPSAPRRVFVVHGEPEVSAAFARAVTERLCWPVTVPAYGDEVALE